MAHESGDYQMAKAANDSVLKHKVSSSFALRTATSATAATKPRSGSIHEAPAGNGRQRMASSSSTLSTSRKVRGSSKASNEPKMDVEEHTNQSSQRSSIASSGTTTTKRSSGASRGTLQPLVNGMEVDEAGLLPTEVEQEDQYPLGPQDVALGGSFASVDEDMSEVESDWPSSSAESSSRRQSSKTETEDDDFGGIKVAVASSDEDLDEEEEEEGSSDESVMLNDLDPDCFVSLPSDLEELAQAEVAQICSRYEEVVLQPAMMKQAMERQGAVERGELAPEVAAHDDELALMGLDPDEVRDTSMVAEYSKEIFEYMSRCEARTMANPNYMDFQGEIRW